MTGSDSPSQPPAADPLPDPRLVEAVGHLHRRDFDAAEALLRALLAEWPRHARVTLGLGIVAMGRGDPATALVHFDQATAIDPDRPAIALNRAQALSELGRCREALAVIDQHAARLRNNPRADLLWADLARKTGSGQAATPVLLRLIQREPTLPAPRLALARMQIEDGMPDRALAVLTPLTENADALNLAGTVLRQLGQPRAAVQRFRAAIAVDAGFADAHANLGTTLTALGDPTAGLLALEAAHRLQPARAEITANLAISLTRLDRSAEAVDRLRHSLDTLDRAASRRFGAGLYTNLANALALLGRIEDGCDARRRAVDLDPDSPLIRGNLAFDLHFDPRTDGAGLQAALADWGRLFGTPADGPLPAVPADRPQPDRPLRVGYVSADFNDHSNANLFAALIDGNDPAALRIVCYAGGSRRDGLTERFRRSGAGWVDTDGLGDRALAERIRADGIDILVDLSGHTQGTRLQAFGYRPAPIQLAWVNATGHPAIDWVLTDRWMYPPPPGIDPTGPGLASETAAEPPWRLPIGALPFRLPIGLPPFNEPEAPDVVPGPALRGDPPVFGCFNNLMKLNDGVMTCWSALLSAIPEARLLLKVPALDEPAAAEAIRHRFAAAGLDPARLILRGRTGRRSHLAAYGDIDVALDPFPGNGGATTWEALWMGVPVITLDGDRPNGRAGASILRNLGMGELVAIDREGYAALAADLITGSARLAATRRDLRRRIAGAAGLSAGSYAAAMAEAFRAMWRLRIGCGSIPG